MSEAARQIAARSAHGLPGLLVWRRVVQDTGALDPSPVVFLVSASDLGTLAQSLADRFVPLATDNVEGLGAYVGAGELRAVLLHAQRKVRVDALPRRVARGALVEVAGTFLLPLIDPTIFVEAPDGTVTQLKVLPRADHFSTHFTAEGVGHYTIEVMGRGKSGPEVVALQSLEVGPPPAVPSPVDDAEPVFEGPDDAAAVLEAINRERQRYGAAALSPDARLAAVAGAYAQELRELRIFAHVSPRSGNLTARLQRVGYPFRSAAENLAQGPSAVAANALAAESPAHRKAMLDPTYTRCGIGLSRVINGDGRSDVLLVEVFAVDGG